MRERQVGASRDDGVPSEIFTSNTARMQAAKVAELQEMTANDAIPGELICGETTRIDQVSLTGLIEKSEGIAVGTPKEGLPQVDADDFEVTVIRARGSSVEVEAAPVVEAIEAPPARASHLRDVVIGGVISIAAMVAWYCVSQL
jgi:hypothetical protein